MKNILYLMKKYKYRIIIAAFTLLFHPVFCKLPLQKLKLTLKNPFKIKECVHNLSGVNNFVFIDKKVSIFIYSIF